MAEIHYCPLCSAYLRDPHQERCPKCHALLIEEKDRKDRYEARLRRKSEIVEGPFHPVLGKKCPICSEDVEIRSIKVEEFTVEGEKIGNGPMGPIHAPNRCVIAFQSWRCRKDHGLFSSYDLEWRELCPHCLTHNNRFGTLVRTCSTCRTMVPVVYYKKEDPLKLMQKRGWTYAPELEEK